MENSQDEVFDVAIAGAGLAGMIMAARLRKLDQDLKILVLEKEESVGGRLRSSSVENSSWSAGLKAISQDLYNYWDAIMRDNPEGADLPMFDVRDQKRLGILMAGKVKEVPILEAFSESGAKAFAGAAAARDWKNVDDLFESETKDLKVMTQNFATAFKGNKRSPSAVVLDNLARLWGVSDLWACQARGFLGRSREAGKPSYIGDWEQAMAELLKGSGAAVDIKTGSRILSSRKANNGWELETITGCYKARKLIVAQAPWEASRWLGKSFWPSELSAVATRSKPTSLVILSEIMKSHEAFDFPDVMLIPAENVQVIIDGQEICFQVTLDYELTMQAPAVVKAVKRLKRARKKFVAAHDGLLTTGDFLALIPVGWGHLTTPGDRRFAEKMKSNKFQKEDLMFCGDAYGPEMNGDDNFITSCTKAYEQISVSLS
mgnify:CR=1 FL=1